MLNVAPPPPRGSPSQGTSAVDLGESMRLALDESPEAAAATIVDRRRMATVSRPHVELIVDKYVVRSLNIPESGLCVGRDAHKCQIRMEHPTVSALHAGIALEKGEAVLNDRSTNGSFVNGKRVSSAKLNDGDYITFGRYAGKSLIFRMGQAPALKIEKVNLDKDRITIGRDRSNDVWVNHPTVSKKHAEVVKQNGRYMVVDLGSTNGTFVNGIRVKHHQLQQLDRIVVGPSELRFEGLSLSHQPSTQVVRLDVLHLSKQVPDRVTGQPRLLLDDISLAVNPRELVGLLGPSGAGKSTLMDAMNGFRPATSGQVRYNGADLIQNFNRLKSNIGYVPQEDIVHRQLTVRKCLFYAAKIRLAEDVSNEEIHQRITEMLETLKIADRADIAGQPVERGPAEAGQYRHRAALKARCAFPRRAYLGPRPANRNRDDDAVPSTGESGLHHHRHHASSGLFRAPGQSGGAGPGAAGFLWAGREIPRILQIRIPGRRLR